MFASTGKKDASEKDDTIAFVTDFIRSSLPIPREMEICIERAHRSLQPKPKPGDPPRVIIVCFLDYKVKDFVIQAAWNLKNNIIYEGQTIYFNQDYTTETQRKRKQVRDVIKKLKEKKVKAQSPYPAQLKIFLDSGTVTFNTLAEAVPTLNGMGITVKEEDATDKIRRMMTEASWDTAKGGKGKRKDPRITEDDLHFFNNSVRDREDSPTETE